MNLRFVIVRSAYIVLAIAVIFGILLAAPSPVTGILVGLFQPPDATPLPPVITAPRGDIPDGIIAFEEWTKYRGGSFNLSGSGFFLRLPDGTVVGLTTAHSMVLGDPNRPLEQVAFAIAGHRDKIAVFDTLHGPPGVPLSGPDLSVDYVLLQVDQGLAGIPYALIPDPRGMPQPGERVTLVSGLGDGNGGRRDLQGTVLSADAKAVFVLMDDWFFPGLMSGSPLLSQHTGKVVGMTIAAQQRGDRILLGFHPIGSIVELAGSAAKFPKIVDFRR
jgi:hypothetical protein